MLIPLFIVISALFGIIIAYCFWRNHTLHNESRKLNAALAAEQSTCQHLREKLQDTETLHDDLSQARADIARLETELSNTKTSNEEKEKTWQKSSEHLRHEFQQLAQQILDHKTQKMTEENKTQLSHLLAPMRDHLTRFEKQVRDTYDKESRDRLSLLHEVQHLKTLNQRISQETLDLTQALKGQSKMQGAWGELVLERVLEQSGLKKGHEFSVQKSITDNAGKRHLPDVLVYLPDDKVIIVDAKVSLTAYERYCRAEDDAIQHDALKQHVHSIQTHIKSLSNKQYHDLDQLKSLDFVIMFLPIEAALSAAVNAEENLLIEALRKNIVLVTPATLLAVLRTVENIWRYDTQARSAQAIAKQAGGLYDKLAAAIEDLSDVGKKLSSAQNAYDTAFKKLYTGKGNALRRAEAIKQLGATTRKHMPLLPDGETLTDDVSCGADE